MRVYYSTEGYKAADEISAVPCTLELVTGFNPTLNAGFLLIFDQPAAPVANDVPIEAIEVPAGGNYSLSPVPPGRPSGRLWFAVSSTGDKLTVSADQYWLNATIDRPG